MLRKQLWTSHKEPIILPLRNNKMKYLKINTEDNADLAALQNAVLQLKGVASAEIVDDENPESELKKAFAKTKEQLKKGDYETLVNDIFDIITKNNSKK
jgi:cell division protein FtsX